MVATSGKEVTGFDSNQAAALTGVSTRQLNHWDSLGIVCPSLGPARGSGSRRRYAADDLLLLAAANALRRAGASLEAIRAAASAIRTASVGLDCPLDLILVIAVERVPYLGRASAWPGVGSADDVCLTVLKLGQLAPRLSAATSREIPIQVRPLQIDGITHQVTIEPGPDGNGFRAHLKGRRPITASGPTPEAALAALRQLAESEGQAPAKPAPKRSQSRTKSAEASAWGGGW